jgi:pyrroloquinoline quinone (PQQ) biosynthesis protein C
MLLSHPFYRRWEAGELEPTELASYGAQYLHFEQQLPQTLAALIEATAPGPARDALQANLDDELGDPVSHVALFETFLEAVEGSHATPTAAYEVQAAAISRSKGDGLRQWYGLDEVGTAFWDKHATLEIEHASWLLGAATALDEKPFLAGVAASRDAWWGFLDDRERRQPSMA